MKTPVCTIALSAALASSAWAAPGAHCGDVNSDGRLGAGDALSVLRQALEEPVTGAGSMSYVLTRSDATDDGSVSAADALVILRGAVGLPATLACPVTVSVKTVDAYAIAALQMDVHTSDVIEADADGELEPVCSFGFGEIGALEIDGGVMTYAAASPENEVLPPAHTVLWCLMHDSWDSNGVPLVDVLAWTWKGGPELVDGFAVELVQD